MNIRDQIRQNVRDLREDKKLTQKQVAQKLEMSETGYAKMERGEVQIRIERLQQLAQIFEVDLSDLIPLENSGAVVFNNSNDNFSNSTNFSFAIGNSALEAEISHLRYIIEAKDELLNAREREIELLRKQTDSLEKLIKNLEKGS